MTGKSSLLRRKLRKFLWKLFNLNENNGNCDFDSNGEKVFIENIAAFYHKQDITVFDVGANVGDYSNILISSFEKQNVGYQIHLFEPTLFCYNKLLVYFGNNNKFIINKLGVSSTNKESVIYSDNEGSGLASLYLRNLDYYRINLENKEVIELIRLDNYFVKNETKHVHFIKMDIEGHEMEAWKGMGIYLNPEFVDFMQFEYGGACLDSHISLMEIFKFLESKGFVVCKIMSRFIEPRKYQPFMDNFEYANYVAVSKVVFDKLK